MATLLKKQHNHIPFVLKFNSMKKEVCTNDNPLERIPEGNFNLSLEIVPLMQELLIC
jgi:hypothetical protein